MSLFKDIAGGVLTGGLYNASNYLLGTKDQTINQQPLETPEQKAAREGLLKFGQTGKLGSYDAGAAYTGSLGDFGMTDLESLGGTKIGELLKSGLGTTFEAGSQTLNDLLTTEKFNPLNQAGVVNPLVAQVNRATREGARNVKRNAAFAGNLYSTDAIRSLGDVEARGNEALASNLSSIYQNYLGQKLGAIPQAFNAATTAENINQGRAAAAFQYGGLQRNLNTAKDQASYTEWQRQRGDQQKQVEALGAVSGSNVQWGTPSLTVPGTSGFQQLLDLAAKFGGQALGAASKGGA